MKNFTQPILLLAVFAALFAQPAHAQDPRFSQFYNAPAQLNPAMTGVFNGKARVVANYRDQWSSFLSPNPFRTYAVSADMRLPVGRTDNFALGVSALHDEAGTSQYVQNRANLGLSFIKQLSGGRRTADHFLSAGAQLGVGQNSMNWNSLWFSNQFNSSTELPDPTLNSGEPTQDGSTGAFLDFTAGLLWYALFENEGFMYAGGALHHLNQPKFSFLGDGSQSLATRWAGHFGGQFPLSHNFYLQPGLQFMRQSTALEVNPGLNVRYTNHDHDELALRAGVWGRIGNKLDKGLQMDALTFLGMIEINRWAVGLSYDVTVSTLTRANNSRGAFEVSLIYIHPGDRRMRVQCPDF